MSTLRGFDLDLVWQALYKDAYEVWRCTGGLSEFVRMCIPPFFWEARAYTLKFIHKFTSKF